MIRYQVQVDVSVPPAQAFAYVAELARHGEWSADPLEVEALEEEGHYRSRAQVRGKSFQSELEVIEVDPPRRFTFVARDVTGHYTHHFIFEPLGQDTRITRQIEAELSLAQRLFFYLVYPFVKRPSAERTMRQLKAKLEGA